MLKTDNTYSLMNYDDCHQYLVMAKDRDEAIKKFLRWQDSEFQKKNLCVKYTEEYVKNEDNWSLDTTIHIIK